jgi:hypothetical protein
MNIQGPLKVLVTGELRKLVLSKLPDALRTLIENNDPVTEKALVRITSAEVAHEVAPATNIGGLTQSMMLTAGYELDLALFAPGDAVRLAELEIPWPAQSLAPYNVPLDSTMCAVELATTLGAAATVSGSLDGISIGLRADGRCEMILRFFKEFPKHIGARDAIVSTFEASKSPFLALTHPPTAGEVLVAEFTGDLKIGAEIGYGWNVGGSWSFGEELAGVDVTAVAKAESRVALSGAVRVQGRHNLVVRPSVNDPAWLNVSFVKRRSDEETFAASVSVGVELRTGDGKNGGASTAEFVDSLLGRTPLPALMSRLRDLDPAKDVGDLRAKIKEATIDRLTKALRSGLDPAAVAVDEAYAELTQCAKDLVAAYDAFDAKVLSFVENAMASSHALSELDDAVDTIDGIASASDLQGLLDDAKLASRVFTEDEVRRIRQIVEWTRAIYGDSLPVESWIRNRFSDLKRLVKSYRDQRVVLKTLVEKAYRKLQDELAISITVEKLRDALASYGDVSLKSLLDDKIVWLDAHLSTKLNRPVDQLVAVAKDVKAELEKLVDGYDRARGKAAEALHGALNRNLMLHASMAWSRLSTNQTLASVDINPATDAGQKAYLSLLRGDVIAALEERRKNPKSIRFLRSYLQDDLCRDFTIRADINGRARVTVDRFILSSSTLIEATDEGEIVVQSVKTGDEALTETRRRLIRVQTMLEVAFEEHFRFADDPLASDAFDLNRATIGYSYRDSLKENPSVAAFNKALARAQSSTGWLVDNESAWEQARLVVEATLELHPIARIDIQVDAGLSSRAFATIFSPDRNPEELATTLGAMYARTLQLMPFPASMPDVPTKYLALVKGTTIDLLLRIHREIFVERNASRITPLIKELGGVMGKLDIAGKLYGRNFAMTLFTLLAAPRDRSGSLRIAYTHPVTGLATETRFDRLPGSV